MTGAVAAAGAAFAGLAESRASQHADLAQDGWYIAPLVIGLVGSAALVVVLLHWAYTTWASHRASLRSNRKAAELRGIEEARQEAEKASSEAGYRLMQEMLDRQRENWTPKAERRSLNWKGLEHYQARLFRLRPPGGKDPRSFDGTLATCELWRGAHRFQSSTPCRYVHNVGYEMVFPTDFLPSPPNIPHWWIQMKCAYRVIWRESSGAVLCDYEDYL